MSLPVPNKPHTTKIAGGVATIQGSHETMLISDGEHRFYIQEGRVFDEAGVQQNPEELQDWFWGEYAKVTPQMKARHGDLVKPGDDAPRTGLGVTATEQNQPAAVPAKLAGDPSGAGGDPSRLVDPERQLHPALRDAIAAVVSMEVQREMESFRREMLGTVAPKEVDPEQQTGDQETDEDDKPNPPADQTPEEELQGHTKEELMKLADDEEIEGVMPSDRKDTMIQKIIDGRAAKSNDAAGE